MSSTNLFESGLENGYPSKGTNSESDQEVDLQLSSDDEVGNFIDDMDTDRSGDENEEDQLLFTSSENDDDENIEDDYDENYDFRDALRSAGNFRARNKKRITTSSKSYWRRKMIKSSNRELDPEVRIYLSQANEAFVRNDFLAASNLYLEVIKKDPKNFSAYKTLGEIYKQQGKLNECCSYWLLAAHINPWDSQFWANVAELSTDLGHIDQAIFCYSSAIQHDHSKNMKYVLDRALLYKEKKQYGRALEGLQKVHDMFPTDTNIIKNLASVYVEQKRLNDAINLYMHILDRNINPGSTKRQNYSKFGWAELNILSELYIQQHEWKVGVRIIKLVSRWIQNRKNETWWDETDDDSEFDKRRFNVLENLPKEEQLVAQKKVYDVPIDIRFKMGSLRLGLEQKDEAMRHFQFLLEEEEGIADLLFEAGRELEEHGFYEDALTFLTKAAQSDEQSDSTELTALLGKCFLEVGDYQQAAQAYKSILYEDPSNLDNKLALAEAVYHLGDIEYSARLLEEVRSSHGISALQNENTNQRMEGDNLSLIKSKQMVKAPKKPTDQEKVEIENNARRKVMEKYRRMERLEESIIHNDKVAITAWMQLASQLVDMFISVRSFFPRDKNRLFKGIILYRRKKQMGIDEKIARIFNLYEGMSDDVHVSRLFLTSTTEYRGLTYDQWFVIFVQYAIFLFKFDNNHEYAIQITDVARSVSVFAQDKKKETMMRLLRLLFAVLQFDTGNVVMGNVRFFLSANQFSSFIYKFFMFCFPSGLEAWETFTNYNHQKYFLRQLKAYDSVILGRKTSGMATITANLENTHLTREHAELLYVYANLLGGSRSYVSSIVYLNRAYKEYNRDPMICLVLGLAHVHRSMQRLSNNRHLQLLQGISFILEYKALRGENATDFELQEIQYNLGRLFHMIGLTTLAVQHYEKVLDLHDSLKEDVEYDLLVEAAYNLSLIYNINGNPNLAKDITIKYLTI
ncbi:uncharacterized protein PRCAT00005647001 [Priceomyces carsonii]|uniref:uncharacterized protein n=1 Tax=Priceomyces carsonii TaxID=28549 RepID=UPI002ED89CC6|nr:unnamed protein product [Priceomyces carsonii]